MALTSKQKAWLETARPLAEREAKRLGISPELILAQAAHESAWGEKAPQNNFFGIKGAGRAQNTQEFQNGRMVNTKANFAAYPDMDASFAGYGDFLQKNSRYKQLLSSGNDFGANVAQIAKSGYATDPAYGQKLAPQAAKPIQKRDLSGEQQDVMAMLGAKRGSFIFPQFGTNLLKGFS
ncbi:PREDICTED: peptidoglycan hydrolase FlgJ-like [Trachymyrmex cornetzi]|uniref:peptidoglycan hydrolase FlgJ-like n=1 Tax=Trachymyrmex cornetzi TaxID=471704 RepID=UPI00084F292F|nr:PREDICTED: peptidoglycan hydrolase FlgJ-like [Trachymyrmex cornetzi]